MIRISFTKIQFKTNTPPAYVSVQIQSETSQVFKLNRKKVKNNGARFYGQFVDFENNHLHFTIKILSKAQKKPLMLSQKFFIKRKTYGLLNLMSHSVQSEYIKIMFNSQIVKDNLSQTNSVEDFSNYIGNNLLAPRLNLARKCRQFSQDGRLNAKHRKTSEDLQTIASINSSTREIGKRI